MNRFSRSRSIAYRVRNGVAIGFFLGPGVRNICLGMIGAARVRAVAVIIKFVPRLGDDVVGNLFCLSWIATIKAHTAGRAAPALPIIAIVFTRCGGCYMMHYAEKIVDRTKAKSIIPYIDYCEAERFMTIMPNIRSINNDIKRSCADFCLRTPRANSLLDAYGQDETIAVLPLGQRLRLAVLGVCLKTVYGIIIVIHRRICFADIAVVVNPKGNAYIFSVYFYGERRHCRRQRGQQQAE